MPGRLAETLSKHLPITSEREAMMRSLTHHENWLAEFLDEVGPWIVGDLIESLCLSLDVCEQKLEIERGSNGS